MWRSGNQTNGSQRTGRRSRVENQANFGQLLNSISYPLERQLTCHSDLHIYPYPVSISTRETWAIPTYTLVCMHSYFIVSPFISVPCLPHYILATMDTAVSTLSSGYPSHNQVYIPLRCVSVFHSPRHSVSYIPLPCDSDGDGYSTYYQELSSLPSPQVMESFNSQCTSFLPILAETDSLCAYDHDAQSTTSGYSSPGSEAISPVTPSVTNDHSPSNSREKHRRHSTSAHPYRPSQLKTPDSPESKKRNSRRIWTHALEKHVFSPHEM